MNKTIGYIICENDTLNGKDPIEAKIVSTEKVPGKSNRVIAEGILQEVEEQNRNGRWYSKSELFPQLKAGRTVELLNTGNLRAENSHPSSKDLSRQQTIIGSNCCAIFTDLWADGNYIKAKFRGTNNALGEEFNADLLDGFSPAWSLRALGSINNTKRGAEVVNIRIITWDQVIYPSHPRAYTSGIVSESGMGTTESGIVIPSKSLIVPLTDENTIRFIKSESANFKFIKECMDFMYDTFEVVNEGRQIQLMDTTGNLVVINLEDHIHNELMNYVYGGR